jgi:hypothetical protein
VSQAEARRSNGFITEIRLRGGWARKIHADAMQGAGIPDIAAVYKGVALWIETKEPNGTLAKLQALEIEKINQAGGMAVAVRTLERLRQILNEIDAAQR